MRASREYTTSRPSAPTGLTGSSLHPSTRLQVGVGGGTGSSFSSGVGSGGAYFPGHHGSGGGSAYNTPSFSPAASPVASTLSSRPLSATAFKARTSSGSTPVGSAGGSFHFAPTSLSSASGGVGASSLGSVSYTSTRGRAPSPSPTSSVARLRDRLASAQIEDMEEYFTGHPSAPSSHTTASPRSTNNTAFIATPSLFSSAAGGGSGLSSSNPTASRSRLGLGLTGTAVSGGATREHRESSTSSASHAGSHQIVNAIREQLHAAALNAQASSNSFSIQPPHPSQQNLQLPRATSTSQGSASSPSASPIPSPSPSDLGSDDDLTDMPSPVLHNASLAKQTRPASAVSAHLGERMVQNQSQQQQSRAAELRESPLVKPVAVSSPALASFTASASPMPSTTPLSLSSATSFSGDLTPLSALSVPSSSFSHGPSASTSAGINPNEITIHVCDENRGVTQDFRCDRTLLIAGMKYFRTYLQPQVTQTLYQEEIDISVHCDLFIFQWLLNYITWERQSELLPGLAPIKETKQSARAEKPILDVNNVVSILISSDFLQMASLVSECIAYMCGSGGVAGSNNGGELANIIRTPVDLKCLSEELVLRIAREGFLDDEDAFFPVILDSMRNGISNEEEKSNMHHHRRGSSSISNDGSKVTLPRGLKELLRLNDKRDKISSRIWMVKLENLLDHRSGFVPIDIKGNIFSDEEVDDFLPPGSLTTRRKSTLCMCQNCEQKFWRDEFEEDITGGGDDYMVQLRALHPHLAPPLPQTALHPSANFCPSLVAHRRVNFHGEITATHRVSEGWNIKKWLLSLRVTHQLNWEQIWWICYGLCHRAPLDCPCSHCGAQSFLYSEIKNCRYHDKEAVWVKRSGSSGGVVHGGSNGHTTGSQLLHPCCGRPSMPFTSGSNGCRSRVHSIQPKTRREKTIYEVAKKFADAIAWSEKKEVLPTPSASMEEAPLELSKKKSITFGKDSFSTIGGTSSTTSSKDKAAAPSILGPALSSTLSTFASSDTLSKQTRSKQPAGSDDESDYGRKQRGSSTSGKAGKTTFAAASLESAEESEEEEARRRNQQRRHRRRRSVASDESGSDDEDVDSYDDEDEGGSEEAGEDDEDEEDDDDDEDEDEDSDGDPRRRRAAALTPAQKAQAQAERLKFRKGYQNKNPHGHAPRPSTAAASTGSANAQRSRSSTSSSNSTRNSNPVVSTNKAKANMSLAEKALQQLRDVLPASDYNALAQTVASSGGSDGSVAAATAAQVPAAKRAQSASGFRVTTGKRPATSGGIAQSRKTGATPTAAIKSILKPSSGASVTIPSAQPTSSPTMDEFSSVWGAAPVRAASPETSVTSIGGGSGGGAFNPYASPTASPDRKKKSGAYDLDSLLEDDRQRMTNLISNLTHSRAASTTATHNPPQAAAAPTPTAAQGRGGRLDRASSAHVRKPAAAFK